MKNLHFNDFNGDDDDYDDYVIMVNKHPYMRIWEWRSALSSVIPQMIVNSAITSTNFESLYIVSYHFILFKTLNIHYKSASKPP